MLEAVRGAAAGFYKVGYDGVRTSGAQQAISGIEHAGGHNAKRTEKALHIWERKTADIIARQVQHIMDLRFAVSFAGEQITDNQQEKRAPKPEQSHQKKLGRNLVTGETRNNGCRQGDIHHDLRDYLIILFLKNM